MTSVISPIMLQAFKRLITGSRLFRDYGEAMLARRERKRFLAEAETILTNTPPGKVIDAQRIIEQYLTDLNRYMFTFPEWYSMYGLIEADEATKRQYISRSRAQKWYRKLVDSDVRAIFHNKPSFLAEFAEYIHRKTLTVGARTTVEQLKSLLLPGHDYIVKPQSGTLGIGVYKITADQLGTLDYNELLLKLQHEQSLIEGCIKGDNALQLFHPDSLNTIRVMTSFDGRATAGFAAFVRFGRGAAVVDNAHAGGIFCTVDVADGRIISHGMDTNGNIYTVHPDTALSFKGFSIPRWDEIISQCCRAHSKVRIPFVGWDVCINEAGQVEFIEGNHAPDVDTVQAPCRKGCREEFENVCRKYSNHK